jgi:hypothetical protein
MNSRNNKLQLFSVREFFSRTGKYYLPTGRYIFN